MKKIFTLLTAALVTLTSFADHHDGRITITDFSRKQILIEVDGKRYNKTEREMVIDDLRPGYHQVQVFTIDRRHSDWGRIFGRGDRKELLYNASVLIKPRLNVCITVNRFGQVDVDERRIKGSKDRDDDWGKQQDRDYDRDRKHDRDDNYDRDNRYDDGRRDNQYENARGMDARSFEMLKTALARESFERSRLEIAKQTIDRNTFTAVQVKEMALLFAFESNKLELAKYAYRCTADKNNYFQVYNVFSFNSSKDELAEYIRRYR